MVRAHEMDPQRKELFVEGISDQSFVTWLVAKTRHPDFRVLTIASVDIPETPGGEKGRIVAFATMLNGATDRIRMFADADFDRILKIERPGRLLLTDGRDLESYFFTTSSFEKFCLLGLGDGKFDPILLRSAVLDTCRTTGLLRVCAQVNGWPLPFQRTEVGRYVNITADPFVIELDREHYLRTLLQNCSMGLGMFGVVDQAWTQAATDWSSLSNEDLFHGKDGLLILAKVLKGYGFDADLAGRTLRTTFEREDVWGFPSLAQVFHFATTA